MPKDLELPPGLTCRALSMSDSRAVHEVTSAQEIHDVGVIVTEECEIVADWQRPSYGPTTRTMGVFDGDRLVAYAEYAGPARADGAVHPDYRARGIGSALVAWTQRRAAAAGELVVGTPVPIGSDGDRLLDSLGYHVRWNSWVLQLPQDAPIAHRDLPAGYEIREAAPDDYRACWTVLEDAFLEWSPRGREPLDDFVARTIKRPGFESWNLRLVTDPRGEVAGATIMYPFGTEGCIDRIATRADCRGRGIAQAMLAEAFKLLRGRGALTCTLNTDSRTGALGLYEKVGMVITQNWVSRATNLA